MTGGIDAHQHFWRYQAAEFDWIEPGTVLAGDFGPSDLRPLLDAAGMEQSIVVQARQCEEETRWLLALAEQNASVAGVVGWVDLQAADVADRIAGFGQSPHLTGFRHVVQDEPDPQFLRGGAFRRGVQAVLRAGYCYDLLIRSPQLAEVPAFLDAAGEGAIVIDHGAKPAIAAGEWQPWADRIAVIARNHAVMCKVSGLVTEADHAAWSEGEVRRYLDHLLDCFGPDRLMFGSDWPVCLLAASYERVHAMIEAWLVPLGNEQREAIMGGNARRFYLGHQNPEHRKRKMQCQ